MTDKTIADTIFAQLGGTKFAMMTGARDLVALSHGLNFRLPGTAGFVKDGITHVSIELTPADYYDIRFLRIRGTQPAITKAAYQGIHASNLRTLFAAVTGLDTSL